MRRAMIVGLVMLGGGACAPDTDRSEGKTQTKQVHVAGPEPGEDAPVVDAASKDPRRNPLAEPDFGAPSLLELEPAPPNLKNKPGTRPFAVGWSKTGEEFGYCVGTGGDGCTTCEFLDRVGNSQHLRDCEADSNTPDPVKTKEIEDRVAEAEYGLPDAKWKYGEVTLVWDVIPGQPNEGVAARLRIGGQVDRRVPAYSTNVREDGYRQIWPELLWLSPEGDRLGVVSHAYAEEGGLEAFQVQLIDIDQLAATAFNGAGMLRSHSGDYEGAIDLFHKAAAASKEQPWSMYNLACSMARTGAPAVRAALTEAVRRGGPDVKAKLATDTDLDSVRDELWFAALAK